MLALNAQLPTFVQWDDHEVLNNWSPGRDLRDDGRYTETSMARLAARAARAFHEMTPIRTRAVRPGAHLPPDRLRADARRLLPRPALLSRRRTTCRATRTGRRRARILGDAQLAWLKRALPASRATWKVIACDMPIGLVSWENVAGGRAAEAIANGEGGPPRGRELEFAELLAHIRAAGIANIVWLTADVHYTAAHHYDPSRGAVPGLRAVLGVRLRPAARRQLRARSGST